MGGGCGGEASVPCRWNPPLPLCAFAERARTVRSLVAMEVTQTALGLRCLAALAHHRQHSPAPRDPGAPTLQATAFGATKDAAVFLIDLSEAMLEHYGEAGEATTTATSYFGRCVRVSRALHRPRNPATVAVVVWSFAAGCIVSAVAGSGRHPTPRPGPAAARSMYPTPSPLRPSAVRVVAVTPFSSAGGDRLALLAAHGWKHRPARRRLLRNGTSALLLCTCAPRTR